MSGVRLTCETRNLAKKTCHAKARRVDVYVPASCQEGSKKKQEEKQGKKKKEKEEKKKKKFGIHDGGVEGEDLPERPSLI